MNRGKKKTPHFAAKEEEEDVVPVRMHSSITRMKIPEGVNALAFFILIGALYFFYNRSQPMSVVKREKYEKDLADFPLTKVFVENKSDSLEESIGILYNLSRKEEYGTNKNETSLNYRPIRALIPLLNIQETDVFYAIGEGVCGVAVQIFKSSPVLKSTCLESAPNFYLNEEEIINRLIESKVIDISENEREFEFKQIRDPSKLHINDASIVFLHLPNISEYKLQNILQKLSHLEDDLDLLSPHALPFHKSFQISKIFRMMNGRKESGKMYLYVKTK